MFAPAIKYSTILPKEVSGQLSLDALFLSRFSPFLFFFNQSISPSESNAGIYLAPFSSLKFFPSSIHSILKLKFIFMISAFRNYALFFYPQHQNHCNNLSNPFTRSICIVLAFFHTPQSLIPSVPRSDFFPTPSA